MRIIGLTLLSSLAAAMPAASALAQEASDVPPAGETRYVTDLIFTPIRTGPGGDYRIINKGLPSGTEVMYYGTTEDGIWAEVETRGGTRGYLRAQYLQQTYLVQISSMHSRLNSKPSRTGMTLQQDLDEAMEQLTLERL